MRNLSRMIIVTICYCCYIDIIYYFNMLLLFISSILIIFRLCDIPYLYLNELCRNVLLAMLLH